MYEKNCNCHKCCSLNAIYYSVLTNQVIFNKIVWEIVSNQSMKCRYTNNEYDNWKLILALALLYILYVVTGYILYIEWFLCVTKQHSHQKCSQTIIYFISSNGPREFGLGYWSHNNMSLHITMQTKARYNTQYFGANMNIV